MSRSDYSYSQIADAVNARAEEFALYVIGEKPTQRGRNELRFFKKGKLKVTISGPKSGNWTNFSEGCFGDMLDLYMWKTGAGKKDAIDFAKGWLGITEDAPALPEIPRISEEDAAKAAAEEEAKKVKTANWLWRSSRAVESGVVEYLANRAITVKLPSCVRSRVLDAEALEKIGVDAEAIGADSLISAVFAATDARGDVRAVQQILIKDGRKAPVEVPKRTNGVLHGAAVKLEHPKDRLILAEGPETGLSVWQATGIPTWIVLGSSNFTRVEIPDSVREIVIAVDMEEKGHGVAAALTAAAFWQATGRTVRLAVPGLAEGDFNDILQDAGDAGVKAFFDVARGTDRPENATAGAILCRSPWDGLAAWFATGYPVTATIRPMNPEFHAPDAADRLFVLLEPGEASPDLGTLRARLPDCDLRLVRPSSLGLAAIAKAGGPEAARAMFAMATPADKETLWGLEQLALRPDARVVLNQTRAAAEAARAAGTVAAALAYNANLDGSAYDWSPLSGREVAIAPSHCKTGIAQAACAAAQASAAGAHDVRVIEWPLFAPGDQGYVIRHRRLPKGYDLSGAVADGWRGPHLDHLMELAVAV